MVQGSNTFYPKSCNYDASGMLTSIVDIDPRHSHHPRHRFKSISCVFSPIFIKSWIWYFIHEYSTDSVKNSTRNRQQQVIPNIPQHQMRNQQSSRVGAQQNANLQGIGRCQPQQILDHHEESMSDKEIYPGKQYHNWKYLFRIREGPVYIKYKL